MDKRLTILCLASYEKGFDFLRECRAQGCRVLLLTSQSLQNAPWPRESIDEVFYMPDVNKQWNRHDTILGVSHLAKTERIDRIVPLDDFDLETAAALREHLRIPGMGETTTRYFRDKLAMRARAQNAGIAVPDFVHVLNYDALREFLTKVPAPWVLKPRSSAGAIGIKKIEAEQQFWDAVNHLGDEQSFYLLERYVPGDVYHVDTIVFQGKVLVSVASRYGAPPMDVSHGGGVFTTRTLPLNSGESKELASFNGDVLKAFRFERGVSHSEFIRARDGKLYFLETSGRVGGAHIADLIEAATGVNMWREWAKVEIAGEDRVYRAPTLEKYAAGLLVSLAKEEHPDTSSFSDPEIMWRMNKAHHIGLIVRSKTTERVEELLSAYAKRIQREFMAYQPPRDRPSH